MAQFRTTSFHLSLCDIFAVRMSFYNRLINDVLDRLIETKNGVFWDVTPCGYGKNRRFGGI
jgi:hypothetical protein